MFDALSDMRGNASFLLLSTILFGGAVALALMGLSARVESRAAPMGALIGQTQRALRRRSEGEQSSMLAFALALMPLLLWLTRVFPVPSMRDSISERYADAGWPGGLADDEVFGISLLVGILLGLPMNVVMFAFAFALLPTQYLPLVVPAALFIISLCMVLGIGLVSGRLSSMGNARRSEISRTMPFVLDLLVLTMRAGAPLRIALQRTAHDNADNAIGIELRALLADMETGVTTLDAFENLAQRAPVPVIRLFVDEVTQAEELGRPVADALEHFSDRVRVTRVQDAVETAGNAGVLVLAPGLLVLFASLILLFAPFAMRYFYGDNPV